MKPEILTSKYCIRTFSGLEINVFEPTPEMICIEDIAHALSNMPRFAGHTKTFYSVAQHSLHVSRLASNKNKLKALLHDASEAYLMDMPKPIKIMFPEYNKIENTLMEVIAEKYKFSWPMCEELKRIDTDVLYEEWDELMIGCKPNIQVKKIIPLSSMVVKNMFLHEFAKLTGKLGF